MTLAKRTPQHESLFNRTLQSAGLQLHHWFEQLRWRRIARRNGLRWKAMKK